MPGCGGSGSGRLQPAACPATRTSGSPGQLPEPEQLRQSVARVAAQGEVDAALDYYQKALDRNPRDTDAMRARKNLAAEQALRQNQYDDDGASGLESEAFLRAARGEDGDDE